MKTRRSLFVESLSQRCLMAVDIQPSVADILHEVEISHRLHSVGVATPAPVAFENQVLIGGQDSIELFERNGSEGPFRRVSELPIDGSAWKILRIEDRFVVTAHRSQPEQLSQATTVYLIGIGSNGQLQIDDQFTRVSDFADLSIRDDSIAIQWIINRNVIGSPTEFATPTVQSSVGATHDVPGVAELFKVENGRFAWSGTFAYGRAEDRFTPVVVSDQTTLLVGERQLHIVTRNEGNPVVVTLPRPESIASVLSVEDYDAESGLIKLRGGIYLENSGETIDGVRYSSLLTVLGSTVLNAAGEVQSQLHDADLRQAALQFRFRAGQPIFGESTSQYVIVMPTLEEFGKITVLTRLVDRVDEQRIELPFRRFGFRPAYVLDDDTIIAIRADVDDWIKNPERIPDGEPELWAYLLKRSSSGEFELRDTRRIGNVGLPATGFVNVDGTVTLQATDQTIVIRENDGSIDSLLRKHVPNEQVFAFIDTALVRQAGQVTIEPLDAYSSMDVNRDGQVTALDALIVINALNQQAVNPESIDRALLDLNGDSQTTAIDALLIINELNRKDTRASERAPEAMPMLF